jgi:hypothetical protein
MTILLRVMLPACSITGCATCASGTTCGACSGPAFVLKAGTCQCAWGYGLAPGSAPSEEGGEEDEGAAIKALAWECQTLLFAASLVHLAPMALVPATWCDV